MSKINQFMYKDRQEIINNIADTVDLSYESAQAILPSELNMHRLFLLPPHKKNITIKSVKIFFYRATDNPCLVLNITADESWVYLYDPETKL